MTYEELVTKTLTIPYTSYVPGQELRLRYLSTLPGNPFIVDINTGWGRTVVEIALVCPQARILSVGMSELINKVDYKNKLLQYLALAGVTNVQHEIADPLVFSLPQTPIDVINFNTDRKNNNLTIQALERWIPLVKSGGLIFINDWWNYLNREITNLTTEIVTASSRTAAELKDCCHTKVALFIKR